MKGVLGVGGGVFITKDAFMVGFVLGEQPVALGDGTFSLAVKEKLAQFLMVEPDRTDGRVELQARPQLALLVDAGPAPDVAKPNGGQHVKWCGLLPLIGDRNLPE